MRSTNGMQDFGDYVVYVNALTTNQLTPEVASEYGIVRSPSRAMLTVSVHRKQGDALPVAVASDIDSSAVNLTGQLKNVLLREIRESEAIYYVGELDIADQETLTYTLDITPEGEDESLTVQFQKQFFVDR